MSGRRPALRRVLVATDGRCCPSAGLAEARLLAGREGEVVIAVVVVVPVTQPLDAVLGRALDHACEVLDQAEREARGPVDTRLVRARSFAKGVLQTLDAERFDLLLVERDTGQLRDPAGAGQMGTLLERARVPVVVLRPLPPGAAWSPPGGGSGEGRR